MFASASLIPELEDIIQHGSQDKRAKMLKRIANLFVDGSPHFNEDHIGLFDDVLCRLVVEIEAKARAEMSRTLAPINNAPTELMKKLAHDEDIEVAGPVLAESPRLKDTDLVELAQTKGQAHLAAIAGRSGIGEAITDVLVRRGDTDVVRNVAHNQTAKLSEGGFSALVRRAEGDGDLAETVGQRHDIPPHLFRDLLVRATAVVQERLLAAARPETRAEIQRVLDKVSKEYSRSAPARDYSAALRTVAGVAANGPSRRDRTVRFRQCQAVRGDGRHAVAALRRADRNRRPADGGRSSRSDPHSLQGGRLRLADRAGDHPGASERQGHLQPRARHRLRQFREAVGLDRPARGAVLAGAAGRG